MSRKNNLNVAPDKHASQETPESIGAVRSFREVLESLAIALVLAFMFKAFAAEAYVIPTGSMATTLMGRHKDINCEQCGFPFQISASEESNDSSDQPIDPAHLPRILAGTCPQCRFTNYVGPDNTEGKTFLSFNGDRIFVNKCCFNFRTPTRWNVTVFRYPGKPQVNYIKRCVGVEGETLRIGNGDIFVKRDGETEFTIQRKPFQALLAMLRPVDDNDYVQPKLHEIGWPTRWAAAPGTEWTVAKDLKSFSIRTKDSGVSWLNYRNIVPSSTAWFHLSQNVLPTDGTAVKPQLITDFVGYNSGIDNSRSSRELIVSREIKGDAARGREVFCYKNPSTLGLNWVGDLAVSCSLNITGAGGPVVLKLVKGGIEFHCSIDPTTGEATLSIPGVDDFKPVKAATPIRSGKTFDLFFCNIDEELRLAVDSKEIDFHGGGRYDNLCDNLNGPLARDRQPTALDLTPVGIGTAGSSLTVDHLKVLRDTYYIACDDFTADTVCDLLYSPFRGEYPQQESTVNTILSSPEHWKTFGKTRVVEFTLDKGQFLMFGDNSARSKDSRLWTRDGIPAYVGSDLLVGEAVFVYWPHGLRIPGTRIALIPNISKVRMIH